VLAVVAGLAIGVAGAVGGVLLVDVAAGADLMVFVLACSLATTTAPMTTKAVAPITAASNLTFFCWSTLTTPFGPNSSATSAKRPFEVKVHSTYVAHPEKGVSKRAPSSQGAGRLSYLTPLSKHRFSAYVVPPLQTERGAHMRLSRSQVASLLAAGAALGMLGAPAAIADPGNTACAPGQIVIDGQCNTPPAPTKAPAPGGSAPAAGTGDQSGHHY
jgi:hypothetical protein